MFGMAKFDAEMIWCQFLNTTAKFGTTFPDGGTRTSIDREWWLLFPTGLWLVAVISQRLVDGCLDGCSVSWSVGHNGDVHAKRAKNESQKNGFGPQIPWHNLAHFCCAKFCHAKSRLFLIFPAPVSLPHAPYTTMPSRYPMPHSPELHLTTQHPNPNPNQD